MWDAFVEYRELKDGTPQEMIAEYVAILNEAHQENRSAISKRYGEMMDVSLTQDWIQRIKETYFVCLQWGTVKFTPKEEFFREENE